VMIVEESKERVDVLHCCNKATSSRRPIVLISRIHGWFCIMP
jgi:hypothetical protein